MRYQDLMPAMKTAFNWTSEEHVSDVLTRVIRAHPNLFSVIDKICEEDLAEVPTEISEAALSIAEAVDHLGYLADEDTMQCIARTLSGDLALDATVGAESPYQKLLKYEAKFWCKFLTRLAEGHFRAETRRQEEDDAAVGTAG